MTDPVVLATLTGEHFQPVRLHYKVSNRDGLLRAFKKLRCVQHDPNAGRWVWLYEHEARKLRFKQSYADLPRHVHPLVLGSFFLRSRHKLLLDLRSPERARAAIPFFDVYIPRGVAKVTEADVVNRLFSAAEEPIPAPDTLFDRGESVSRGGEEELRRIVAEAKARALDPEEKVRLVMDAVTAGAKQPLPEIERFPIHYYEDGLVGLANALTYRQIVALQHWLGNTAYTLHDAIQAGLKRPSRPVEGLSGQANDD